MALYAECLCIEQGYKRRIACCLLEDLVLATSTLQR